MTCDPSGPDSYRDLRPFGYFPLAGEEPRGIHKKMGIRNSGDGQGGGKRRAWHGGIPSAFLALSGYRMAYAREIEAVVEWGFSDPSLRSG